MIVLLCILAVGALAGVLLLADELWLRRQWRIDAPDDHDLTDAIARKDGWS